MTSLGELTEKYNLRKVCYAIENIDTIINKTSNKNPTYIKQTLLKILLKNGDIDVAYHYSAGSNFGRQYSHYAMQSLDKNTRNFLLNGENITDIDMVSSAPSTLKFLAEKYEITKIPCLTEYVSDKYEVMKKNKITKQEITYLLFEEKRKEFTNKWLRDFQDEIFKITERLTKHKDFANIKKYIVKKKGVGKDTSLLANIIFKYENEFLMEIKKHIEKELEIFGLQFDGLQVYDLTDEYKETWSDFNKQLQELTGNPYLKVVIKPFDTTIVIPDEYVYTPEKRNKLLRKYSRDYETVKAMWEDVNEKNATLVKKGSTYFVKEDGFYNPFRQCDFLTSYQSMKYDDVVVDKDGTTTLIEKPFIDRWMHDENRQEKNDIESYSPTNIKCNPNNLNIYEKYDIDTWKLENYKYDKESVDIFKEHILYLAGDEEKVAEVLMKWIANIFQYPDAKCGLCPIIVSKEGVGKDLGLAIPAKMIGSKKYLISSQPEREVYGNFNSLMSNAKLVQISEISQMNTSQHMGKIRTIITSETIVIDTKGLKPYHLNSSHSFIIATNYDTPIKDLGRRFMIMRVSERHIGDTDYFDRLLKILNDKNALKSIHQYLMELKDVPEIFTIDKQVESEYQKELKKVIGDEDYIAFFKDRCIKWHLEKNEEKIESISSLDLYKSFLKFRAENHYPNKDWNITTWGIKTAVLKIDYPHCFNKKRMTDGMHTEINHTELFDEWALGDIVKKTTEKNNS